jgi:hypothetical protein
MNFSLELFIFFYFKSPSDVKTASQNRSNTYGSPCSLKKTSLKGFVSRFASRLEK